MAKRFIISENTNKTFDLIDKKTSETLLSSKSFDDVFKKANEVKGKEVVYGLTNIIEPSDRHPKFKNFKTPVRCSYEFE